MGLIGPDEQMVVGKTSYAKDAWPVNDIRVKRMSAVDYGYRQERHDG